jgi:hypothetical protein
MATAPSADTAVGSERGRRIRCTTPTRSDRDLVGCTRGRLRVKRLRQEHPRRRFARRREPAARQQSGRVDHRQDDLARASSTAAVEFRRRSARGRRPRIATGALSRCAVVRAAAIRHSASGRRHGEPDGAGRSAANRVAAHREAEQQRRAVRRDEQIPGDQRDRADALDPRASAKAGGSGRVSQSPRPVRRARHGSGRSDSRASGPSSSAPRRDRAAAERPLQSAALHRRNCEERHRRGRPGRSSVDPY